MNPVTRLEQRLETTGGKGVSKLLMAAFGLVTTALLGAINSNLHTANELAAHAQTTADGARDVNYRQERDIALLNVKTDAIERKTDATVTALQALILQVTKNQDSIEHNMRGRR